MKETITPANFGSLTKELTRDPKWVLKNHFPNAPLPAFNDYLAAISATWEFLVEKRLLELCRMSEDEYPFHINACKVCQDAQAGHIPMPKDATEMLAAMVYDYRANIQGMLSGPASAGKPFHNGNIDKAARKLGRRLGISL
jgi:hypothetical protein